MERESNLELKEIQQNIKQALLNNKIEPTTDSIIKYTIQAIFELENDQMISQLLSILLIYKDFLKNSSIIHTLINEKILGKHQEKVFRILKSILHNDEHSLSLFKDLLSKYKKKQNLKLKKVLDIFCIKDQYAMNLDDDDFLEFYNMFFDSLVEKVDFRNRLGNLDNNLAYNILLQYTNFIIEGPRLDDTVVCEKILDNLMGSKKIEVAEKTIDEKSEALNFVLNKLISNKDISNKEDIIMKIINKVTDFDNNIFMKSKVHIFELTKDIKDFFEKVITDKNTNIELAQEFFNINRLYLIPNYIAIIRNITCMKLLQYIVSAVDVEILSQIIDLDVNLLRFSSNNDISLFFRLYEKDNNMINIMSTFLDYCTDNENLILKFTEFLKSIVNTNYGLVGTCLRNIIRSHELNIQKEIHLRNNIGKETSKRILKEVTSYEIFKLLILNYEHNGTVNDLLYLMTKYLPNMEDDCNILSNEIIKGKFKNLHIVKFFISKMNVSIDFVSKILDECSKSSENQKKFYDILYHLEKNNKIGFNICSELYAQDMVDNLKINSLKMRMKCLYTRILKGCCNNSTECRNKFLASLMMSFCLGNACTRDINISILEELMNTEMKGTILDFIELNIKSNDSITRSGCLSAFSHLLRNNVNDMKIEYMKNIYSYLFVIYKDVNALIIIKILGNYIAYTQSITTKDILDIVEYYIDNKKKKYRKDIKNLIRLIISKKEFDVNRRIKQYYKFKIKTENEEIIIKKNK